MTKILVECPGLIPSVRVGVLNSLRPLEKAGFCEVRFLETQRICRRDLCWCDILITVRGCEAATFRIVQEARRLGRFVVYFLDDDLLHVPTVSKSGEYFNDIVIQKRLVDILSISHVLWAVNPLIIQQYGQWCPRTILTRIAAAAICPPTEQKTPVHIVYAGSVDHKKIAQELLVPAVEQILDEFPGQVDFTFIGVNPGVSPREGIRQIAFMDSYDAYSKTMQEGHFSIGLAPAYRTPFYACKYFNKFVEYSSYGIAGIYSDCGPFPSIVRHRENGLLCACAAQDWYQAICCYLQDPALRQSCASNAQNQLQQEFSEAAITDQLTRELPELCTYTAPTLHAFQVRLPSLWWAFVWERLCLTWRNHGLLTLLIVPWKALQKIRKKLRKK